MIDLAGPELVLNGEAPSGLKQHWAALRRHKVETTANKWNYMWSQPAQNVFDRCE
jgi:hypothetical protein